MNQCLDRELEASSHVQNLALLVKLQNRICAFETAVT